MITRKVHIHDWTILFLFSFEEKDLGSVLDALFWAQAPDSIVKNASDMVLSGELDQGFTYSDQFHRRTVFAIGRNSSGPEVLDSTVHEIIHITQHIAGEDGIDTFGEEIAYLGGDISRSISDIVCKLSCPHCGGD